MDAMSALWSSAGAEIQAALVGNGLLVLGGAISVLITAAIAVWQFKSQRALELKKEVLLNAVGAAHDLQSSVGALGNFSRPFNEITAGYQHAAATLVRASAVADLKTVEAGAELIAIVERKMHDLLGRRATVEALQIKLSRQQELVDSQLSENRQLRAEADSLSKGLDLLAMRRAQSAFNAGHKMFLRLIEERNEIAQKLDKERWELMPDALRAQWECASSFNELISAVRCEMGASSKSEHARFMKIMALTPMRKRRALSKLDEWKDSASGSNGD